MKKELFVCGDKQNNKLIELFIRYYFDCEIKPANQKVIEIQYQKYKEYFDKLEFFKNKKGFDIYLNVNKANDILKIDLLKEYYSQPEKFYNSIFKQLNKKIEWL